MRVVLVCYEGFQLLDLAGPADVLDGAGGLTGKPYTLVMASVAGGTVRAGNGLALDTVPLASVRGPVDTLLVAGGWGTPAAMDDEALRAQLRRLAARARRTASVCSGTFLLAAAGLLDGRRATTHWAACDHLARRFPRIDVEPDRIFVRDGALITSAGVTAGMDLALALVEEDHGAEVARQVARWLVMFLQRPGGQSQFSVRLQRAVPEGVVRRVVDEIVADPAGDHRVPALAARACVSERHLTRLFLEQAGETPARYVERVRVEAARARLEAGEAGVEAVARAVGFGTAETMRRAFVRRLGVPPSHYRARFAALEAA